MGVGVCEVWLWGLWFTFLLLCDRISKIFVVGTRGSGLVPV